MAKERVITVHNTSTEQGYTIKADDALRGFAITNYGREQYYTADDARAEIERLMRVKNPAGPGAQRNLQLMRQGMALLERE